MESNILLETREIMWNIPPSFKVAMYIMFAISLAYMFFGLYRKAKFVAGAAPAKNIFKKDDGLFSNPLNWKNFFKTIFLTGKVPRKPHVGLFHALIYYGFIVLWIATDLVAIHYDTPFKVFQGTTYIVVSFMADMAGIAMLIGIGLAYYRRYVLKPKELSATNPNSEKFMYFMLVNLVLVGFLIEGIRIYGTGMPAGEQTWSPIGWIIAVGFSNIPLSDTVWAMSYRGLWFFHMVVTMVFIASFGHSKFFHAFALPLNALVSNKKRNGAILSPMDFEDEEAETFGLGNANELSFKNRLDLISCVECGRCTESCPANGAGKNLDPKLIITKMRDFVRLKDNSKQESEHEVDYDIWGEDPIYQANELDACTTCGACIEECPANIDHINIIMEARRYKTLTLGEIPPAAGTAVNNVRNNGNPWGIAGADRFKWADGLDVPVIEQGKKVDYLYYIGCAGSYDAANQKVVKDTIALLKSANVNFAVLGKEETCNGDPIRRFGDEYSFYEIAIGNIETLNQYQFDKIVTHCPHCLHTIGKEYVKFTGGNFETVHHTELLAELLKKGQLQPKNSIKEEFTFHDPCYLGRHHGQYDAPRSILKQIPDLKLKEMERNKDRALCCGMGGGNMWYELPEGEHLATNRVNDIADTNVKKLASACSYCMINFNSSKASNPKTEELEVEDIASILARSTLSQ